MADEKTQTKNQLIERLTEESRLRGFQEFPKMKYHPDGRVATVNSSTEESNLGGEWCNLPQQALDERKRRDEEEKQRLALKIAEEAEAERKRREPPPAQVLEEPEIDSDSEPSDAKKGKGRSK